MSSSVLILAAHPDDEVLGCGGTIAKLASEGATVNVAFLADGVSSRKGDLKEQEFLLARRRKAATNACEILGVKSVWFGDFPDNQMDALPLLDISKAIEGLLTQFQPDTIFTHHSGDVNVDHACLHKAAVVACRPQQGNPVKNFLCFEVPSSTEWQIPGSAPIFVPNWFVDISSTVGLKMKALDEYASELRAWPHPRSRQGVEHLAHWRGATVGLNVAEAFMLGRKIE